MADVILDLDRTPNTNHTGIYAASERGYYADAGVEVRVRSPAEDDYEQTPANRVATGEATVAIAPSESAISYHTHPGYEPLRAIAAVCQRDTNAVVALADSDIDGRTYASYDARFEDHLVEQLARNDGGEGDLEVVTPPKLGIPNTLLEGEADATRVFMPCDGVLAERDGIGLEAFSLDEYDVPYGYTPVMLARPEVIDEVAATLSAFLEATARGYRFAADRPAEAAAALSDQAAGPNLDDEAFLEESARALGGGFRTDAGECGWMDQDRWRAFVEWLASERILATLAGDHIPADEIGVDALYTNEHLR